MSCLRVISCVLALAVAPGSGVGPPPDSQPRKLGRSARSWGATPSSRLPRPGIHFPGPSSEARPAWERR